MVLAFYSHIFLFFLSSMDLAKFLQLPNVLSLYYVKMFSPVALKL